MKKNRAKILPKLLRDLYGNGNSRVQEENLASQIKGRRQPGSGNKPWAKGDVKSDEFLIEAKTTKHESIRITWKWLKKITKEALAENRKPAFVFELRCKDIRNILVENEWVAVPKSVWLELIEREK